MTVNLLERADQIISNGTAVLVLWSDDGTVLISSHADALSWVGELPSTKDYFIDVKSISEKPVPYTLEVINPPNQAVSEVEFQNTEFGFSVSLPRSCEGFSIQTINWEGSGTGDEDYSQGPLFLIVHPESTAQSPR